MHRMIRDHPHTTCFSLFGTVSLLMGILSFGVFTPIGIDRYNSEFHRYILGVTRVQCVDITNRGNTYTIQLPSVTPLNPPRINQTTIPTLYLIDNWFLRPPYYELQVSGIELDQNVNRTLVYSVRYKFMNQCSDFGNSLVRQFLWNRTRTYVYTRGSDVYPMAYPTYDVIVPYVLGAITSIVGVLFLILACCAGITSCPGYTFFSRRAGNGSGGARGGFPWSSVR